MDIQATSESLQVHFERSCCSFKIRDGEDTTTASEVMDNLNVSSGDIRFGAH